MRHRPTGRRPARSAFLMSCAGERELRRASGGSQTLMSSANYPLTAVATRAAAAIDITSTR